MGEYFESSSYLFNLHFLFLKIVKQRRKLDQVEKGIYRISPTEQLIIIVVGCGAVPSPEQRASCRWLP